MTEDRRRYEDDEPIEKIEEILSRPADGVTEPPNTGSETVFMGPSPVSGKWQPSRPTTQAAEQRDVAHAMLDAMRYVTSRGVVLIASPGNEGPNERGDRT